MESGPLRKVRMGCSLKVEDEVGHSDDIDTEKGLRRSKRVGYFLRAIKDHTKQEERKANKQSKKLTKLLKFAAKSRLEDEEERHKV
ncbi:hypothetical protein ACFX13_026844 [Malus domestica]